MKLRILAAVAVLLVVVAAYCKEGETRKEKPAPVPNAEPLEERKPEEGDLGLRFPEGKVEVCVWKGGKMVKICEHKLDLPGPYEATIVPYDHKVMKQFFEWKEKEVAPKNVHFVIVQQSHGWVAANLETGKILATGLCVHYYHFLVDSEAGKLKKKYCGQEKRQNVVPDLEKEFEKSKGKKV